MTDARSADAGGTMKLCPCGRELQQGRAECRDCFERNECRRMRTVDRNQEKIIGVPVPCDKPNEIGDRRFGNHGHYQPRKRKPKTP